jgi:hypothetical protein
MSLRRHTAGSTTRALCRPADRGVFQRRLRGGPPGVPSRQGRLQGRRASRDRQLVRGSRRRLRKHAGRGVGRRGRRARAADRGVGTPRGPRIDHRGSGATTLMPAGDPGRARRRQGRRRAAPGRDGRPTRPDATGSEPRSGPVRGHYMAVVAAPLFLSAAADHVVQRGPSRDRSRTGSTTTGRPTAGFGGDPRRSHAWGEASTPCSSSGSRVR